MKITFVALCALHFAVGHAQAFIEVTAELAPYREKKESSGGTSESSGTKGGASPVPVSAVSTKSSKGGDNQEKMLVIAVRNASKRFENELIVRYWFIGRDMKTMRPVLMDGGEASADLKPNATFNLTSDPVKGTVTRKSISPGKLAEATGVKVAGYVVQVIKGGKVIGESLQELSYKKLVGSEGKNPGPFFTVAKPDGQAQ